MLLNTGPTADGRIAPIMEERLRQMGKVVLINGISAHPYIFQNQSNQITLGVWQLCGTSRWVLASFVTVVVTWHQWGPVDGVHSNKMAFCSQSKYCQHTVMKKHAHCEIQ